jgi:hypothetical protein
MTTYVRFRDIEKGERKRLSAEASRQPHLRAALFAAIFVPLLLSGPLADYVAPMGSLSLAHFGARLVAALILAAIIWEIFGRRRLKADVEKLKNA